MARPWEAQRVPLTDGPTAAVGQAVRGVLVALVALVARVRALVTGLPVRVARALTRARP